MRDCFQSFGHSGCFHSTKFLQPETSRIAKSGCLLLQGLRMLRKLTILGPGLLGGSIGLAARQRKVARRVESLVAGANFFELPKTLSVKTPQPDRFQYSLQIAHEDGREHAITCDEEAAGSDLRDLLYTVQNLTQV